MRLSLTLVRGAAGLTPKVRPKEHVEVEAEAEDLSQQVPEQQVLQARTDSQGAETVEVREPAMRGQDRRNEEWESGLWSQAHLTPSTSPLTEWLCDHGQGTYPC